MIPYKARVFISSTIYDMPNERSAALKAIEALNAEAIMSEFTINAQSIDSVSACLNKVASCDLYVLILGGRYGWQPFDDISITEMEYKKAQETNKPTLVFNASYYNKEELQEAFAKRVGASFFWKTINDAFELKDELVKSIREEFDKWEKEAKEVVEPIYSNLLTVSFPDKLYIADLNLDREQVIKDSKETLKWLKKSASWFEIAVSAIHQRNISFPHDWIVHEKQIVTFHDLSNHRLPIASIIDLGTVTELSPEEFYSDSEDKLNVFRYLLKQCLQTKLYKLKVNWFKKSGLFAFMPTTQDGDEHWANRKEKWTKKNAATRTVVKVTYGRKADPNLMTSARHLAFFCKVPFV